jgi:hypothetical protein
VIFLPNQPKPPHPLNKVVINKDLKIFAYDIWYIISSGKPKNYGTQTQRNHRYQILIFTKPGKSNSGIFGIVII